MHRRDYGALLDRHRQTIHLKTGGVKVIAAATDFTPAATAAVHRAAQLAHAHGARIALIYVITPVRRVLTTVLDALGANNRSSRAAALSNLRGAAARIIAEYGVPVDTQLASGDVPSAVATLAQAASADLVVLGNTQSKLLADLVSINTAHSVRRRTSIPVLAVSNPVRSPYARVLLLAADLAPEAARAQCMARRLFPGAALTMLHAFESADEGLLSLASASPDVVDEYRDKALHEAASRFRLFARDAAFAQDANLEVCLGHPAACTRKRVRKLSADVVVLPSPTSSLSGAMTSGVIEQLLADPPCDALLVA
jgi:nucleotide-binding universal stress UspA family protein